MPTHTIAEVIVDQPPGAGGWSYATVIADVADQASLEPMNLENTGCTRWVTAEDMAQLPLHPGVAPLARRLRGER